jgi:hypothetical protein
VDDRQHHKTTPVETHNGVDDMNEKTQGSKTQKITSVRSRNVKIEIAGIVILVKRHKTKSKRTVVRVISSSPFQAIVTGVDNESN